VVRTPDGGTSQAGGSDSDSPGYSLSITLIVCCSEKSEWILDMGATYHVCLKWEWFASFEKLDGGLVMFGDGHTCYIKRLQSVSSCLIG